MILFPPSWELYSSQFLWEQNNIPRKFLFPGNAISSLLVDGVPVEGVLSIRVAVYAHFQAHEAARPSVDNLVFRRLYHGDGASLVRSFSVEEVKAAVWDCDSYKSPGPDGINFGFIKYFWAELKGDIMRFITHFHKNNKLTKGINSTFIALIPKIDSPQKLNDFRPISLVGSLYKILAKLLATRLCWNKMCLTLPPLCFDDNKVLTCQLDILIFV